MAQRAPGPGRNRRRRLGTTRMDGLIYREPGLVEPTAPSADPLTGLPGRQAFQDRLDEVLARPMGSQELVLLTLDLRHFGSINDTLGQRMGDAVLQRVAARLRAILRGDDILARTGGDEFSVLGLAPQREQSALSLGHRLLDMLARPYLVQGQVVNLTVCIGMALAGRNAATGAELQRQAQLALRHAKQEGRSRLRLFEPELANHAAHQRALESDLRKALLLRQLELHYQPQLCLAAGRITGFEALLRWRHPEHGLLLPDSFLPLAEELGLMAPIGEWVLRQACLDAARWASPLAVAVNIAAPQLAAEGLVAAVRAALAASGLAPQRLELEVTETVVMHEAGAAADAMQALRQDGLRVAMDDFGTGYSSLAQLTRFPFDAIKVDRSFVSGTAPQGAAILQAAAGMARGLGLACVAEGVETEGQLETVREAGCSHAQGWLVGRPMPVAAIAAFLAGFAWPGARQADLLLGLEG